MKKLFIGVNLQNDFINRNGTLFIQGSEQVKPIINNFIKRIYEKNEKDTGIWFILDLHTKEDFKISSIPDFVKTFPPHCIAGTNGQFIIKEINEIIFNNFLFNNLDIQIFTKNNFFTFKNNEKFFTQLKKIKYVNEIYIFGIFSDMYIKYIINEFIKNNFYGFNFNKLYIVIDIIVSLNPKKFDEYIAQLLKNYNFINVILSHQIS